MLQWSGETPVLDEPPHRKQRREIMSQQKVIVDLSGARFSMLADGHSKGSCIFYCVKYELL